MAALPSNPTITTTQNNYSFFSLENAKKTAPAALLGFAVTGGSPLGVVVGAGVFNLMSSCFGSNPKMTSAYELGKYAVSVGVAGQIYLTKIMIDMLTDGPVAYRVK
ncbi:hypothetical protein D5R81_19920 [Parashewanella spongiae]|uniref:Uncharacterized protein n=1 Tax=Parashewanella spongiae TaxID=342950 RepID=A0A3A6TJY3_9GAMM|nr:hypothetical protein [Parashewanella spongiae]MCL1080298.1 hypothetical protein [Parashewanella spongiae]RJY01563.1 hypothetical protein D5R81_19920 [Parashewanella spongiae]